MRGLKWDPRPHPLLTLPCCAQTPIGTCLGAPGRGGTHLPGLVHTRQEPRELGQGVTGGLQSGPQSGIVPGQLLLPVLEATGKKGG